MVSRWWEIRLPDWRENPKNEQVRRDGSVQREGGEWRREAARERWHCRRMEGVMKVALRRWTETVSALGPKWRLKKWGEREMTRYDPEFTGVRGGAAASWRRNMRSLEEGRGKGVR